MAEIVINDLSFPNEDFSNALTSAHLKTIVGGVLYININNFYDGINTVSNTKASGSGGYQNYINSIDNSRNSYNYIYVSRL